MSFDIRPAMGQNDSTQKILEALHTFGTYLQQRGDYEALEELKFLIQDFESPLFT
jgi:hypothetical protein